MQHNGTHHSASSTLHPLALQAVVGTAEMMSGDIISGFE